MLLDSDDEYNFNVSESFNVTEWIHDETTTEAPETTNNYFTTTAMEGEESSDSLDSQDFESTTELPATTTTTSSAVVTDSTTTTTTTSTAAVTTTTTTTTTTATTTRKPGVDAKSLTIQIDLYVSELPGPFKEWLTLLQQGFDQTLSDRGINHVSSFIRAYIRDSDGNTIHDIKKFGERRLVACKFDFLEFFFFLLCTRVFVCFALFFFDTKKTTISLCFKRKK